MRQLEPQPDCSSLSPCKYRKKLLEMFRQALIFGILALNSASASTDNDTLGWDEINNGTTGINMTDLRNDIRLSTKGNLELQKIQAEMWKVLLRMLGHMTQTAPPPSTAPPALSADSHVQERLDKIQSKLEYLTRDEIKLQRKLEHVSLQRLSKIIAGIILTLAPFEICFHVFFRLRLWRSGFC